MVQKGVSVREEILVEKYKRSKREGASLLQDCQRNSCEDSLQRKGIQEEAKDNFSPQLETKQTLTKSLDL